MNKHDELIGEPALIKDLTGKKDRIGMIVYADLENDEITVNFGEGGQASFATGALMVLRDTAKIRIDADNDITLMPFWDYEDIMEIAQLAASTQFECRKFAIQLSQKNPGAMEYTMNSLRHELNLDRKHIISR